MMVRRLLSGPSLIVLGVIIASMLGLGIARSARPSAREVCFGNLSRLAQAALLYVADNDGRFPPHQMPMEPYTCQWGADSSNPWLRWPVLLDRYLPDRSVYVCPALETPKVGHGVWTRPHWIARERITSKGWPNGPCGSVWPPGWGGAVTDSALQGECRDPSRFVTAVGAAAITLGGRKLSEIADPRHHVVWADSSRMCLNLGSLIWANACRADCADLKQKADWENCPWSKQCGAGGDFSTNATARRAFTRHDGGSNIAFLDGHVEWQSVNQIIRSYRRGELGGVEPATATKGKPWYLRRK